jgi:hypothetical protein
MNKQTDYVQFTLSSTNPKYDGITVNMPLAEFVSIMEMTDLQEQLGTARPNNKPHRIQEF